MSEAQADLDLIRKAADALAEIDRTTGLDDRHADVLAALRIRIEGGPRKSLEELVRAAGDISGKRAKQLDERLMSSGTKGSSLDDLISRSSKPHSSLDDLLSKRPKPADPQS